MFKERTHFTLLPYKRSGDDLTREPNEPQIIVPTLDTERSSDTVYKSGTMSPTPITSQVELTDYPILSASSKVWATPYTLHTPLPRRDGTLRGWFRYILASFLFWCQREYRTSLLYPMEKWEAGLFIFVCLVFGFPITLRLVDLLVKAWG